MLMFTFLTLNMKDTLTFLWKTLKAQMLVALVSNAMDYTSSIEALNLRAKES